MSNNVVFSPKQAKVINYPFDINLEVFEGTPRSSKTTAAVFRCARYLVNTPDRNHLVTAYNQEQAFRLFIDCDGMGLMHIFKGFSKLKADRLGDHLEIKTPNGVKKVYYKSGGKSNDAGKIRGMSLGSVWFMEIDLLNMEMIQECFRRTIAAQMRYHFADLNPPSPEHPVIKQVFDVHGIRWTHWTMDDNPILTEKRKKEVYNTLKKSQYLLDRDWFGKRVIPEGVIYAVFNRDGKNVKSKLKGEKYDMFFTGDGGQSDATSVSCNIVTFKQGVGFKLNRVAHYYHSGAETGNVKSMSQYAKDIKKFIKYCHNYFKMQHTDVLIDPACLSLREELSLIGVENSKADNNNRDARKKGGGIEVGIERAQNLMTEEKFYLIEDDGVDDQYGHYHFKKELGLYVRDKNGNPISGNDHALDEFRYSVNHFHKRYT